MNEKLKKNNIMNMDKIIYAIRVILSCKPREYKIIYKKDKKNRGGKKK